MSLRLLADRRTKTTPQGRSEATADEPGGLREPRPEETDLVKSSEDWRSNIRNESDRRRRRRRRQSKDGSSQVSGTPDPQHRHSTPPNMPALSTNIPLADRLRRSASDPMNPPHDNRNRCFHGTMDTNTR
ncbi:hypothetical protein SprV_0200967900 [Sparganum proliferum]